MADYFLLAVSTKENLDLCKKHALAGFPSTVNGVWAFSDVGEGDFVSFLYGARVYDLFKVRKKRAVRSRDGQILPPWPPLVFRSTGREIDFPFRLELEFVRKFEEPLVRPEFSYIAENLLRRGGYWKTHFQADRTTLQLASRFGEPHVSAGETVDYPALEEFVPKFSSRTRSDPPTEFRFQELILQSAIRRKLRDEQSLTQFLSDARLANDFPAGAEVLGEKAIEEGLIDLLIQDLHPQGSAKRAVLEIKFGKATRTDVGQLQRYVQHLGSDCVGGILVSGVPLGSRVPRPAGLGFFRWSLSGIDAATPAPFATLVDSLNLSPR